MATNPILAELSGLSPGAQQALVHAHTAMGGPGAAAAPTAAPTPKLQPPGAMSPTPAMGVSAPPNLGEPNMPAPSGHNGASLTLSHGSDPGPPPAMSAPTAGPMPSLAAPTSPSVSPPIRGTEQGDQLERSRLLSTGPGIGQIHSKIENSSFGQNHPTLGKILGWGAEIPLRAAEVAGSMLGPTRAAETFVPGTQMHHALDVRNIDSVIGKESEENLKGAQTGETEARTGQMEQQTAEAPQRAEDTHALTQAEIQQHNAQSAELLHPQAKTAFEAWQQQNPGKPIEEWLKAQSANKPEPKPDTPEQQYIDEYQQTHKGASIADAERHYTLDTQRPPQVAPIMMMVPNQNGGSTATVVRPGQEVAPGTTTAAGLNSESVNANKQDAASKKATADAQKEYQIAQRLAANPSPTNDVALLMRFIGATKPDALGKLRLNQNEVSLVLGTRSSFGDLEALAEKVQNGQKLTPQQRTDMLSTMKVIAGGDEGSKVMVQHSPSTGQYRYSNDGGQTWQAGQPPSQQHQ